MPTVYNDPIDRLILDDVLTTLATVTIANGYHSTVGEVVERRLSPLEIPAFNPAAPSYVSVIPLRLRMTERRPQAQRCERDLVLHVWLDATVQDGPGLLGLLVADVKRALQVDQRRSGYAIGTFWEGDSDIYGVAGERLCGTEIAYTIPYLTSINNPYETAA